MYIIDNVKKNMAARAWPNMFPCRSAISRTVVGPQPWSSQKLAAAFDRSAQLQKLSQIRFRKSDLGMG